MTAAVVVGSIVAYFAVGLVAGRAAYTHAYNRGGWIDPNDETSSAIMTMLFWPVVGLVFCVVRGGARLADGWFSRTVANRQRRADERKARVKTLRADAAIWDHKLLAGTDAEQEMAAELARMCREQADELERAL